MTESIPHGFLLRPLPANGPTWVPTSPTANDGALPLSRAERLINSLLWTGSSLPQGSDKLLTTAQFSTPTWMPTVVEFGPLPWDCQQWQERRSTFVAGTGFIFHSLATANPWLGKRVDEMWPTSGPDDLTKSDVPSYAGPYAKNTGGPGSTGIAGFWSPGQLYGRHRTAISFYVDATAELDEITIPALARPDASKEADQVRAQALAEPSKPQALEEMAGYNKQWQSFSDFVKDWAGFANSYLPASLPKRAPIYAGGFALAATTENKPTGIAGNSRVLEWRVVNGLRLHPGVLLDPAGKLVVKDGKPQASADVVIRALADLEIYGEFRQEWADYVLGLKPGADSKTIWQGLFLDGQVQGTPYLTFASGTGGIDLRAGRDPEAGVDADHFLRFEVAMSAVDVPLASDGQPAYQYSGPLLDIRRAAKGPKSAALITGYFDMMLVAGGLDLSAASARCIVPIGSVTPAEQQAAATTNKLPELAPIPMAGLYVQHDGQGAQLWCRLPESEQGDQQDGSNFIPILKPEAISYGKWQLTKL